MHIQLKRILFLLTCGFGVGHLDAQEVLQSDAGLPAVHAISVARSAASGQAFKTTTISLPFFDDFSSGALYPDTARWAIHPLDVRRPTLSLQKGHHVPSKGVATFDGADRNGAKYEIDLQAGLADTLASQPIDLSTYSVSDSIYLSFFVERGGTGESPEVGDSLVVLFDTTGNYDYSQVWALHGIGAAESHFKIYRILLDTVAYFHSAFRFKFEAFGSQNGELDQFHLDYVFMDARRTISDTTFVDRSVTRIGKSPMYPYTAVPLTLYPGGMFMADSTTLIVSNLDSSSVSVVNFKTQMNDSTGMNVFAGTTNVSSIVSNFAGLSDDSVRIAGFSDQSATLLTHAAMAVQAAKTAPSDAHPENDSLTVVYPLDSILAYDDGVSDFGYGLTTARAFCQEFHIPHSDSLVAVWMHFAPSIYYNAQLNQSYDLDEKGFRLVVWDSLSVDSSLVETSGDMNVHYGSAPNTFFRYKLIKNVLVDTVFWVGLRQVDGQTIGLGFDKNGSPQPIYYENSLAEFQRSTNVGCLMIRPEFKAPPGPVAIHEPSSAPLLQIKVAPQPIKNGEIRILMPEGQSLHDGEFRLMDLQGRLMRMWSFPSLGGTIVLPADAHWSEGIYLLQATAKTTGGMTVSSWEKVVIRNN